MVALLFALDLPSWLQMPSWGAFVTVATPVLYTLGGLSALDAMLHARTSQGATAWVVALALAPLAALPAYWVFGRSRFQSYVEDVRSFDAEVARRLEPALERTLAHLVVREPEAGTEATTVQQEAEHGFAALAQIPFTQGNDARLLIDGEATFKALFEAIERAREYILIQFYIVRDDELGEALRRRLLDALERGVAVFFLYDEIGSHALPRRYVRTLTEAGAQVADFGGPRNWLGRFRLNFRNHRKVVVVDGDIGFVGGLNVGDEYLGRDPVLSPWRDTHLAVWGPIVQALQLSFTRDWHYSQGQTPSGLDWTPQAHPAGRRALVAATGPADEVEACRLLFAHAIGMARERFWIATPYFVPDAHVLGALQAAALRGVDVRVLMPRQSDSVFFKFVPYAFLPDAERTGVKVFLYEEGFMHQKTFLVDDCLGAVSTANLDNRSLRLNFEITALVADEEFAEKLAAMFEADFARSTRLTSEDLAEQSFGRRLATAATRLLAPVL